MMTGYVAEQEETIEVASKEDEAQSRDGYTEESATTTRCAGPVSMAGLPYLRSGASLMRLPLLRLAIPVGLGIVLVSALLLRLYQKQRKVFAVAGNLSAIVPVSFIDAATAMRTPAEEQEDEHNVGSTRETSVEPVTRPNLAEADQEAGPAYFHSHYTKSSR